MISDCEKVKEVKIKPDEQATYEDFTKKIIDKAGSVKKGLEILELVNVQLQKIGAGIILK